MGHHRPPLLDLLDLPGNARVILNRGSRAIPYEVSTPTIPASKVALVMVTRVEETNIRLLKAGGERSDDQLPSISSERRVLIHATRLENSQAQSGITPIYAQTLTGASASPRREMVDDTDVYSLDGN